MIQTYSFSVNAKGNTDRIYITGQVQKVLSWCKLPEGLVLIFVSGSTEGLTTVG